MATFRLLPLLGLFVFYSCKTSGPGLFGKDSPHEQYARKLEKAELQNTVLGKLWFTAAQKALAQPQPVSLPYRQVGYFGGENPRAVGLKFTVRKGEKLLFGLSKKSLHPFALYTDLWQVKEGAPPSRVFYGDTTKREWDFEVDDAGTYILRLQPELLQSGEYTLSISVGPSLGFPVAGPAARIGSFWGDDRDGGARRHEGIDIFAPKRTPVVAAADGIVARVNESGLGGKVVWMRASEKSISLYYAHLDEQLVSPGQRVKKGDTLGLVGNTGNARHTPPHLHFGIYALGGAIDPFPFVNPTVKTPPEVTARGLNRLHRISSDLAGTGRSVKKNTVGLLTDAGTQQVFLQLPDTTTLPVSPRNIQQIENQIFTSKIKEAAPLLDHPHPGAPKKASLSPATSVGVLGYYNDFILVKWGEERGWVQSSDLR